VLRPTNSTSLPSAAKSDGSRPTDGFSLTTEISDVPADVPSVTHSCSSPKGNGTPVESLPRKNISLPNLKKLFGARPRSVLAPVTEISEVPGDVPSVTHRLPQLLNSTSLPKEVSCTGLGSLWPLLSTGPTASSHVPADVPSVTHKPRSKLVSRAP